MIEYLTRLSTFSALRHRDYRLFWTGSLVSLVGTWMQSTAQSFLVWELTRSAFATSLTFLFFSLPSTVLSLVGGVVADRMERRALVLTTQTVFMLQALTLTVLTFTRVIEVWHVYLLALVNGTVMAFDSPARQSMLPSLVEREDLGNAIALNSTVFNAARVIGPPIAGLVYAAAGPAWCFAVNTVTYAAILYSLWIIRPKSNGSPVRQRTMWWNLVEGMQYVRSHSVERTLLLLVALVGTFAFTYVVLMPVVATRVLGRGPAENGYLLGAAGVGATLGGLMVATLRPRRPGKIIAAFGYAAVLCLVAFSFSRNLALSMALSVGIGGSIMALLATCNTTIQFHLPDTLRGRIMSLYTLALIGSGPLNSLIAGLLGSALGAPLAIAISGSVMGLGLVIVAMRNREVFDLEMPTALATAAASR
ncbi:MAG TPA: MFS transporter [bacterium]|nr:MFS transporter [bacterium]